MNIKKAFIISLWFIFGTGCGTYSVIESDTSVTGTGGSGLASVVVAGSKGLGGDNSFGVVKLYRVTITGSGIEEPIVAEFGGEESGGIIEGIPKGEGREVVVEAINESNKLIRIGESSGITIRGGEVTDVEVELDAVPQFTNLDDGNVVADTRLKMLIFDGDPGDQIAVMDLFDGTSRTLFDLSTGSEEIYPDASTGMGQFVPKIDRFGEHQFEVVSIVSGRSSKVRVNVIDGSAIFPAPIYAGGFIAQDGAGISAGRIGGGQQVEAKSGSLWSDLIFARLRDL